MPNNKNQHFVPRAHFKPFSIMREGKAINLVNIEAQRAIKNASVSGQCSGDYFYGENPVFEQDFQDLEAKYGVIVKALEDGVPMSRSDLITLRRFALIQYMRTEAARKIAEAAERGHLDRAFVGEFAAQRPSMASKHEMMQHTLQTAVRVRKVIDDLKVRIFKNGTNLDFVTSDNPSVVANRWAWQRHRHHEFGLGSSGIFMSLPLNSRMSLCFYDQGTYSCPGDDSIFRLLRKRRDVEVLNELQILNAEENVYFADWSSRKEVLGQIAAYRQRRPTERMEFSVLVRDGGPEDDSGSGKWFREATEEEAEQPVHKLINSRRVIPVPTRWPSCLKIRSNPRVFNDGSSIGDVRDPALLRG
jgi:hypothetical protein